MARMIYRTLPVIHEYSILVRKNRPDFNTVEPRYNRQFSVPLRFSLIANLYYIYEERLFNSAFWLIRITGTVIACIINPRLSIKL